jgi:PknH-like extracellular domain
MMMMIMCGPLSDAVFVLVLGVRLIAITRGYASALSILLLLGSASGCTVVVDGWTRPAPGLAPRPLTGNNVRQVLLDSAELSRTFGQPFTSYPNLPPESGGGELLQGDAYTPPQCGGVPTMLLTDSYAGSDVRDVARESWLNSGPNPAVISVHEAVVGLPTTAAADVQFTELAQQWARCDGATITIGGDANYTFRVGHVEERNSVLATNVDHISSYMMIPAARAIGVRVNCIVEVEVIYYGREYRDGSAHHTPTAADLIRLLTDKVSAQS